MRQKRIPYIDLPANLSSFVDVSTALYIHKASLGAAPVIGDRRSSERAWQLITSFFVRLNFVLEYLWIQVTYINRLYVDDKHLHGSIQVKASEQKITSIGPGG